MSNTTTEFWDVDGHSLNNYAWNIETLGGRLKLPQLRGSDIRMPYAPGEIWRPKLPDTRTLTLAMWVKDSDKDGYEDPAIAHKAVFNDNWDQLVRIFFVRSRRLALTRRILQLDGSIFVTAARAELASDMGIAMLGRSAGNFTVDLKLADPYFYAAATTTTMHVGDSIPLVNLGHDMALSLTIKLYGPLTNPVVYNGTPVPAVSFQYFDTIAAGDTVTLNTGQFSCTDNHGVNQIANVFHTGARQWMILQRGTNAMEFTADAGTGSVDITYQEPYL